MEGQMSSSTCPKCNSANPQSIHGWSLSFAYKVAGPPGPMWACLNPTCLHKWPMNRQTDSPYPETLSSFLKLVPSDSTVYKKGQTGKVDRSIMSNR